MIDGDNGWRQASLPKNRWYDQYVSMEVAIIVAKSIENAVIIKANRSSSDGEKLGSLCCCCCKKQRSICSYVVVAVGWCCCSCWLIKWRARGSRFELAAMPIQPRLFGRRLNSFMSFLRQANQNLRLAYLDYLFQIKTWKIKLSLQDNPGNFKYGLLYQTNLEKWGGNLSL